MKRKLLIFLLTSMFLLSACTKDNVDKTIEETTTETETNIETEQETEKEV